MSKGASMSTVESSSVNKGATPAGAKHQVSFARLAFERLGMLPVLVVMYALFYGLTIYFSDDGTSNFVSAANNMNILRQVAINLVLAAGMTFVILTGGIDLSVGSMLAVAAVLGMKMSLPDAAPWLALPTFILAGLACGMLNGTMVAYFNINPFVVTLGTMTALRGITMVYTEGRPISTGFSDGADHFAWLGIHGRPLLSVVQ